MPLYTGGYLQMSSENVSHVIDHLKREDLQTLGHKHAKANSCCDICIDIKNGTGCQLVSFIRLALIVWKLQKRATTISYLYFTVLLRIKSRTFQ